MKKNILKLMVASAIWSAPFISNAQTATRLQFNNSDKMVEFGYSVTEYNGYSIIGSEFRNAINVFHNGNFKFQAKKAANTGFGHGHSMNSNFIAAGAHQVNNSRGVVYLSKHVNGQPVSAFNTIISAQNPGDYDQFGKVIDMHNEWMVIGAPNVNRTEHGGYIEIWRYTNNTWVRHKKIGPNLTKHADFGSSVAIRGNKIVVGAPGYNRVFIYRYENNNWVTEDVFAPNRDTWAKPIRDINGNIVSYNWNFGYDVDITDGKIIVGDPYARKAAVLTLQGTKWVIEKTLLPPSNVVSDGDRFGHSVAIQYNRAVVGAPRPAGSGKRPNEGKVYLYTDGYNYKGYMYVGSPSQMTVRALGYGVAIDGDQVLAGASNSDNLQTGVYNEGGAFRMPFYYVFQSGNWREAGEEEADLMNDEAVVYPNPSKENEVFFKSSEPVTSAEAISTTGIVIPLTIEGNMLNVSNLSTGVYSLKIVSESGIKIEKFVKE